MVLEKDRLTAYLKQPLVEREKKLHNKPQSQYEKNKTKQETEGFVQLHSKSLENKHLFFCLFVSLYLRI